MSLSVGIVGLPNVGKSTLFNALLQKQQAFAANYPFATIEPNVGVVPVVDKRLEILAGIVKTEKIVPATVTFVDIAGLVRGAADGEGLGNKFLANIRETSLILHVLRAFEDSEIVETGSGDYIDDYQTIETELQLADMETLNKQKKPRIGEKDEEFRWEVIDRVRAWLEEGKSVRDMDLSEKEFEKINDLFLLTAKPRMFVFNVDEEKLSDVEVFLDSTVERFKKISLDISYDDLVVISAKLEEDLVGFDAVERFEYLVGVGAEMTGLEFLIKKAYRRLGLLSFLTAGEKEVRAWTIRVGLTAPEAAGVIHSDFEKHFIRARVCNYDDFVKFGGWKNAAEAGKVRQEGREYIMQDGDVVEFIVNA